MARRGLVEWAGGAVAVPADGGLPESVGEVVVVVGEVEHEVDADTDDGHRYSTVTDLARLRGWSTSLPRAVAISHASTCNGTVVTSGASSVGVTGT